ncbi:SRPBCC domain-containing protein [Rhodobacteraceae bacterium CCMM004]|nr:SRPBCC domain-containing protein [Rhodobacteraceae bacterium CCMM004]
MSDAMKAGALEIVRRYPHPVAAVFGAWSSPEAVKPWWGPAMFAATAFACDFREGGAWSAVIVGPDGTPLGQSGRYTRIEPDRLIAFTFAWDDADAPETEVTVAFAAEGEGTLVTFRQAPFASEGGRLSHQEGWGECLHRLSSHLGRRAP